MGRRQDRGVMVANSELSCGTSYPHPSSGDCDHRGPSHHFLHPRNEGQCTVEK